MTDIVIIISETEGGLSANADLGALEIIEETRCQFSGLATFSDPPLTFLGNLGGSAEAWICLARPSESGL
jgi:hypothetical protein